MSNYFKHKMRGKSPGAIAGMIIFGIIAISGLAILFGFIIMWLWNWLMPGLFDLPMITYWQGVGLFILAKILLGGCGDGGGGKHKKHHQKKSCEGKRNRKTDFSKWEHYDKFWEEKGDKAYREYVSNIDAGEVIQKPHNSTNENDEGK